MSTRLVSSPVFKESTIRSIVFHDSLNVFLTLDPQNHFQMNFPKQPILQKLVANKIPNFFVFMRFSKTHSNIVLFESRGK